MTAPSRDLPELAVPTRRLPRPAEPVMPAGWTDHGGGLWSWTSTGQTVTVSISVNDEGAVSAPSVSGLGKFWLVSTELERACAAMTAWLNFRRSHEAWERFR